MIPDDLNDLPHVKNLSHDQREIADYYCDCWGLTIAQAASLVHREDMPHPAWRKKNLEFWDWQKQRKRE